MNDIIDKRPVFFSDGEIFGRVDKDNNPYWKPVDNTEYKTSFMNSEFTDGMLGGKEITEAEYNAR